MNITIKDVPKGAEKQIKEMALVAIERFLRERDVRVAEEVQSKFETDIDAIREANELPKKFEKVVEPIGEPIK